MLSDTRVLRVQIQLLSKMCFQFVGVALGFYCEMFLSAKKDDIVSRVILVPYDEFCNHGMYFPDCIDVSSWKWWKTIVPLNP